MVGLVAKQPAQTSIQFSVPLAVSGSLPSLAPRQHSPSNQRRQNRRPADLQVECAPPVSISTPPSGLRRHWRHSSPAAAVSLPPSPQTRTHSSRPSREQRGPRTQSRQRRPCPCWERRESCEAAEPRGRRLVPSACCTCDGPCRRARRLAPRRQGPAARSRSEVPWMSSRRRAGVGRRRRVSAHV